MASFGCTFAHAFGRTCACRCGYDYPAISLFLTSLNINTLLRLGYSYAALL